MIKIIRRFLFWSLFGLTVTLSTWVVVANLIAAQYEKKIDEAKENFRIKFTKRETNNSALKFEELTAKLGLDLTVTTRNTPARKFHVSIYEVKNKEFENIRRDLEDYLSIQLEKPNNEINVPPEKLQQYLNNNANLLKAVQKHILNSSLAQWEIDYLDSTLNDVMPSFLSLVYFQKILTLNILEKTRLGQNKEAVNSLKASWKFQQYIAKRPELISQLIILIIAREQALVMRKMPNLSSDWQSRIERNIKYNFPESFIHSLVTESFVENNSFRKMPIKYFNEFTLDDRVSFSFALQFIESIYRPYLRLTSIDNWYKINKTIQKLPQEYFCSFTTESFIKKYKTASEWWNLIDVIDYTSLWKRVIKVGVQMELTQKIIQVKEIANQQGNWPKEVSGIESSAICQDAKWIYQVSDNGIMSISLSKEFDILKKKPNEQGYTPISYSAKYQQSLDSKDKL